MATQLLQQKTRALRERLNQSVAMRLQQRHEPVSRSDLPERATSVADTSLPPAHMPNELALNPPNTEAPVARGTNACTLALSTPPLEQQPVPAPTAPVPTSDTIEILQDASFLPCESLLQNLDTRDAELVSDLPAPSEQASNSAQNKLLAEYDDVVAGTNAALQKESRDLEPAKTIAEPVRETIAQAPITKAPETTETPLDRILRKQNRRSKQQGSSGQISANASGPAAASNQRASNRKTTQLAGHICNEGSSTMIDVVIKDLSGTGARVSLSPKGRDAFSPIPKIAEKFHLYITYDRMFVRCRLQWQNGDAIGVQYLAAPQFY